MKKVRERREARKEARALRRSKKQALALGHLIRSKAPVNVSLLAPTNSYGPPEFVERGYYLDKPFSCKACGKREVWRATQQKWWYEQVKGDIFTEATRCRPCRRIERERKRQARETHLAGLRLT